MINYFDNNNEYVFSSLKNRQALLESAGHIPQEEENKIIVLTFINEFLGKFQGLLTRDDIDDLDAVMSHLIEGNCFIETLLTDIPYYTYQYNITGDSNLAITEDYIQKITFDDNLRSVEQ